MCKRYYFVSSRIKERADGYLMISTSKGIAHANDIAKTRFKSYGYKGKPISIYPFSVANGSAIAI